MDGMMGGRIGSFFLMYTIPSLKAEGLGSLKKIPLLLIHFHPVQVKSRISVRKLGSINGLL